MHILVATKARIASHLTQFMFLHYLRKLVASVQFVDALSHNYQIQIQN